MPQGYDEDRNAVTGEITRTPIPWTKDAAKALLASMRYDREVAGITVNGLLCATERGDHRHNMLSLFVFAQSEPNLTVSIKMPGDGWIPVTAAQAAQMYLCGQQYVAACFAVEKAAVEAIEAATTDAQIDAVFAGLQWPEKEFMT